jgi:hypothetical protein
LKISSGAGREKLEQPGSDFTLGSRRLARRKKTRLPIIPDHRLGEAHKLGMTAAEILLAVVGARACGTTANRALAVMG